MSKEFGINFPLSAEVGRSSTEVGKAILAASVRAQDPGCAQAIEREDDWRGNYPFHFEQVLRVEALSREQCLAIAQAGLEAAQSLFVHVDAEGDHPLRAALDSGPELRSLPVAGQGERVTELSVPYRGEPLRGDALLRQLDQWVARGITEPSMAEAVGALVRHPQWLDLRGRCFGVVGAASELGPVDMLLGFGARIAAVDLPRPAIWQNLCDRARASAGSMLMPVPRSFDGDDPAAGCEVAGANLFTDVGALVRWLEGVYGPLTLGNYGYADGAGFVRLTMAFDLLFDTLAARRKDLSVAYLATPSDVFLVPMSAIEMSRRRHADDSRLSTTGRFVHAATEGRMFKPNYDERSVIETARGPVGILNAFILPQGPNYALAKRLQRWRMIAARGAGMLASVHIAPPSRTRSVHHNPAMEERQRHTAYLGIETFDAATTAALSTAILIHDLANPDAIANPATPLAHPQDAFMFAANPGGRWRVPFDINSSVPLMHHVRSTGVRLDDEST